MEPKSVFASKTIWLNVITLAVMILGVLMADQSGIIKPEWLGYIGLTNAILNVLLRFVTEQPVTLSGK
jgi:hypothetical protein